jgi:hypothetical protein
LLSFSLSVALHPISVIHALGKIRIRDPSVQATAALDRTTTEMGGMFLLSPYFHFAEHHFGNIGM